ncbi:TIGR03960 family B12-binding radical SAM protein [Chitinivibrio alkaliphilus]|uniref:Radical SAM protein n=1 Tax=Chitinivibrio alkaliphilus ACht1 TaxID=1313304 RepID=U7D8C0_9BACT|nr:TIGR03960 family B12-binding radical SAM protein [Chitinivibrio alkaliphilus]ERP39205.1 radical SAM protein [Chitinivibrio alkaliphilus ACht1]
METLSERIGRLLLPFVENPSRYSGGELNIAKKNRAASSLCGVLCFPEVYDIGMSHYGSQVLYHLINRESPWFLSRAYMPWEDAEAIMRREDIPLYALEDRVPVRDADWVGFSLQYELQYSNLVTMLELSGIPVFSHQRGEDDPLIIAGGPVTANPEPVADFIDVFLPGDGEESLPRFCRILEESKGMSRREILSRLSREHGNAYVPALHEVRQNGCFAITATDRPIPSARIATLREEDVPRKQIVPLAEVVHNTMAVEVMRGCTQGCRFCSAGMYYRPVRERAVSGIVDQIEYGVDETGWNTVTCLSLSTVDYSEFGDLLCRVADIKQRHGTSLSLPSTRIDAITSDEFALFDSLAGSSSITIAPEAGSERLRRVINKNFTTETILSIVRKICETRVKTVKLYFMVGLPTETMDDMDEMIYLIEDIQKILQKHTRGAQLNISLSPFSPKPHTPFQWHGFAGKEVILERCKHVKAHFYSTRSVKVSYRNPQVSFLETVLSRGDRRLGAVIYGAQQNGARFDGWQEYFYLDRWLDAAAAEELDLSSYVSALPDEQALPWDTISQGFSEFFLKTERERALRELPTRDCRFGCVSCGVCGPNLSMTYAPKEQKASPTEALQALHHDTEEGMHETTRVRVWYAKQESLRFLPHQSMVNSIIRGFNAAGVPVAFSQGMRPRPKFSFGPPLPQGACGDNELFDVTVRAGYPLCLASVAKYLPHGLVLKHTETVEKKAPALNSLVVQADWHITAAAPSLEVSDITAAVTQFYSEESLVVVRTRKNKKNRTIDVKPLVRNLRQEKRDLFVTLSAEPGNSCKPSEFLAVLFPHHRFSDFRVIRTALYGPEGSL